VLKGAVIGTKVVTVGVHLQLGWIGVRQQRRCPSTCFSPWHWKLKEGRVQEKKPQSDPIQWKGVEARGNESASGGATLDEGPLAWVPSDRQGIFSPSSATAQYW
jgi:hypothetical protein